MLHTEGRVFVEKLVETFDVSEVSIRKDLAVLEERKLLVRVKGGAIALHQAGDFDDMSISSKQRLHTHEKQLIGKFAAAMIHDGDRIILLYDRLFDREIDNAKVRRVTKTAREEFVPFREALILELSRLSDSEDSIKRFTETEVSLRINRQMDAWLAAHTK